MMEDALIRAVLDAPDRGTTPLLRDPSGALRPIDWPEALATLRDRIRAIQSAYGCSSGDRSKVTYRRVMVTVLGRSWSGFEMSLGSSGLRDTMNSMPRKESEKASLRSFTISIVRGLWMM